MLFDFLTLFFQSFTERQITSLSTKTTNTEPSFFPSLARSGSPEHKTNESDHEESSHSHRDAANREHRLSNISYPTTTTTTTTTSFRQPEENHNRPAVSFERTFNSPRTLHAPKTGDTWSTLPLTNTSERRVSNQRNRRRRMDDLERIRNGTCFQWYQAEMRRHGRPRKQDCFECRNHHPRSPDMLCPRHNRHCICGVEFLEPDAKNNMRRHLLAFTLPPPERGNEKVVNPAESSLELARLGVLSRPWASQLGAFSSFWFLRLSRLLEEVPLEESFSLINNIVRGSRRRTARDWCLFLEMRDQPPLSTVVNLSRQELSAPTRPSRLPSTPIPVDQGSESDDEDGIEPEEGELDYGLSATYRRQPEPFEIGPDSKYTLDLRAIQSTVPAFAARYQHLIQCTGVSEVERIEHLGRELPGSETGCFRWINFLDHYQRPQENVTFYVLELKNLCWDQDQLGTFLISWFVMFPLVIMWGKVLQLLVFTDITQLASFEQALKILHPRVQNMSWLVLLRDRDIRSRVKLLKLDERLVGILNLNDSVIDPTHGLVTEVVPEFKLMFNIYKWSSQDSAPYSVGFWHSLGVLCVKYDNTPQFHHKSGFAILSARWPARMKYERNYSENTLSPKNDITISFSLVGPNILRWEEIFPEFNEKYWGLLNHSMITLGRRAWPTNAGGFSLFHGEMRTLEQRYAVGRRFTVEN